MSDRNSTRTITGLDPVQDVVCDRVEVSKRIRLNAGTFEVKSTGEIYKDALPEALMAAMSSLRSLYRSRSCFNKVPLNMSRKHASPSRQ